MRVLVLYNEPLDATSAAECDVLNQVHAVQEALRQLGHASLRFGCTLDLGGVQQRLRADRPDVVFNLVEGLGGTDRLMPLVTMLLDALSVPYTGAGTRCLWDTSDKLCAKRLMRAAGLPTPDWVELPAAGVRPDEARDAVADGGLMAHGRQCILKPVFEHASTGIDDGSVQPAGPSLIGRLDRLSSQTGRPHFAEAYVDGREFNLSVLAAAERDSADSLQVLPPAEIDFSAFAAGKPRIVGHAAKWDEDSFEYQQTPRRFAFPASDRPLLGRLAQLASAACQLFDVRGYGRVDFRVDAAGQPWILEVNANPCLSPDAGFAAALQQAGIPYAQAIQRLVAAACQGRAQPARHAIGTLADHLPRPA